jgi:hypothetical protein
MPFLTRNNKRKFDLIKSPIANTALAQIDDEDKPTSPETNSSNHSDFDRLKKLEKEKKEKDDIVRRLKLVQHYKSRVRYHTDYFFLSFLKLNF